jgi:ornithine cyclodeaminase/alanine dehydrogenase-like protein (mu-crystallin family)
MQARTILVLSAGDIDRALSMHEAIEAMRRAFLELSEQNAVVPLRTVVPMAASEGQMLCMPAYSPTLQQCGMKFLTVMPRNPAHGLPLIHALYLLADGQSGQPVAFMDGERLTALRTGAASGVATDLLARREAKTAVIFGAGVQGRAQLEAVCAVRHIERVTIVDPDITRGQRLCEEVALKLNVHATASTASDAVREADIICTATTSPVPIFSHDDLRPGVHINAVGAYRPFTREIPGETVRASRVVADSRSACLTEAGDLVIPLQEGLIEAGHIYAEVGELVGGKKSGRGSDDDITLFKSVGNAIQDLYAAHRVLTNAMAREIGSTAVL